MAVSSNSPTRPGPVRPLPRPGVTPLLLQVAAVLVLVAGMAYAVVYTVTVEGVVWQQRALATATLVLGTLIPAILLYALSLLVRYGYHTALTVRTAERRSVIREIESESAAAGSGGGQAAVSGEQVSAQQMLSLLREINENTLLGEADKVRKRDRVAEVRREQMKAEVEKLIDATKWPAARARIEDLKAEGADDAMITELERRLDDAIREHRELEVMAASEQIRSYMSLGLWEKARYAARQLTEKYPDDPEAQKMDRVVDYEQEATNKEDRLRLYREIEHLVARKHYRDARRTAEMLIDRYPESPEAASLKGQMEELERNADIETRREMEAQIIDYTQQGRHKEAYDLACLLMEQYPESPQAQALKDRIDALRERAGVS